MTTLNEFMIVGGADNHPPMHDKAYPLVWPTVEQEDDTVRLKTYEELSDKEKLQADCDLKATNIVLKGLPPDVYSLFNHHKVAKDIWDRVKLLMQGTSLSKQERECKLYDEFDKFSHVKGETLHQYYLRFAQLITDMNIIQMTMQLVQVNTKFLNSLPPEWGLAVLTFLLSDDPIACMNKEMAFLSAVFSPRYPSTNNQLISSSNLTNQATVQDGRVTVQQVQGRQGQDIVGSGSKGNASGSRGNTSSQVKVIKCYNCQAEGKELDEEQLAFLVDPRVADDQVAQTITHNAAFQTDDLDAYESDCDDISSAKAVPMANLSSCDSDVLFENSEEPSTSNTPVKIEVPSELPKLQAKDTVIRKLKETIHSLRDNANPARVKQDVDEIETINIELEHKKVFVTTTLQNELRRLKDKNVLDNATTITNATTIALVITEYLVNISKRRAFWSLNEDILKITVLTTNTPIEEERIIFKSFKLTSSLIKRVYMLCVRERMELDLEARLMGETLVINRSLDPLNGDYIKLNDLNEPFELRRNQGDDLMPTIEEGEVIEEFRTRSDELDIGINDYPILENMAAYRDEGMGDVIVGEPFLKEIEIKARRFKGMITIYNGNDEVTYQMVRSHPRFKHHTNEQCNKIPPLLKVSEEDKKNGISHPYQKLKGFYTGVLDLGPDYIRDAKTDTLACMRWNSKEKLKKSLT
ncbi:hypothetical protein Tco_1184875 [Tanacetum coccineum]